MSFKQRSKKYTLGVYFDWGEFPDSPCSEECVNTFVFGRVIYSIELK